MRAKAKATNEALVSEPDVLKVSVTTRMISEDAQPTAQEATNVEDMEAFHTDVEGDRAEVSVWEERAGLHHLQLMADS